MTDKVFPSRHPLVAHKLSLLRNIDTKHKKFRELVREIAILLAYEATADLDLKPVTVTTPMGQTTGAELTYDIGLVPILRAGLGMVEGVWEMVPQAEVWHIGLKRNERTLEPMQYYAVKPIEPHVQVCLMLDPMLATGGSASAAVTLLKSWGVTRVKYVGLIAAPEGIARLQTDHPDVPIHIGAVDSHLNEIGYIVPGLGDAGDRQFGTA